MPAIVTVVLVLAVGALVFDFAVLSVIRAANPWLKALPSLVPFAALVATVLFSVSKDTWLIEFTRSFFDALQRKPIVLYVCTTLIVAAASGFSWYVWKLSEAKEGRYTLQVVKRDDVPEQAVQGLPVILEHKLKSEALEKHTDASGKASFELDMGDVFAVRIRKSADPQAALFVLASDAQVNEKVKTRFDLVRLTGIPSEAWISRPDSKPLPGQNFAQLPAEYFRWHDGGRAQHVIDVDNGNSSFPFSLPSVETTIRRRAFTVGFSPVLKLPRWVAYRIAPGNRVPRKQDIFVPDPDLPAAYQATSSDYSDNDFDRGHLVRRSDMFGLGESEVLKVFYLSAVVPQLSYVNQKTCLALEDYASGKAVDRVDVYVIRGPVYQPSSTDGIVNVTLMGSSLVPVPTHFFQVLIVYENENLSVEGHIVPNTYVPFDDKVLTRFRTTVAGIAEKTGLVFDERLLQ